MRAELNTGRGRLYRAGSEQYIVSVRYQINEDKTSKSANWWGELTPDESVKIDERDRHIIELEDGRRGMCSLRKMVNRVVSGIPPRYSYHFTALSPLV